MTSRPPLAVSQRQPQRTLSGSGLSQRPVPQRTLSQQYLPPSPIRRSESFSDQAGDAGDGAQGRYATTGRRGGSRLKLELANDGIEHAGFSESPLTLDPISANRVFTPSRFMTMNDVSDLGDISPHTSPSQSADVDSSPLPMPPRRARFAMPARRSAETTSTSTSAPAKKDTRPKPFVLEAPSLAPRYPSIGKQDVVSKGYADFAPWRGGHPEDQFSDSIIRHGYFDKAPAQSTQEAASAKAPLFPAMKHKSGLHTLSTIFTTILNQRRHSGQITSASTFKPPPRVTLTDTKREVWLKDLANPAISLRRLSRTIPHGIRGRVLLDQCLNKNVPTERAVWLAKCVGANEIRAFKRKGVNNTFVMGGEVKWIRDWTLFVEQFVESVVNAFADDDWKTKVTYAIRLATHLYAEHLLDRDHFMDWLVSGLENSSQAKLPMWLLILKIYWKDLLRLRRHGRRLVAAILNHHCWIYHHPDRDILEPLAAHLASLVDYLISSCPESFVHPATWSKFQSPLQSSLTDSPESSRAAFRSIGARNEYLTSSTVKSQPAVRSTLVKILDKMLRSPFDEELSAQLQGTCEDKPILLRTVLEWCTSLYRFGVAKVYVATGILRSASSSNVDITRNILDFLAADPLRENSRKGLVYHLISELIRSNHFSVPQYVQWLIARGGLCDLIETQPDGPCLTRLLVEIPIHSLNESMKSLRASLLRRASFAVDDEANDIATAIKCVKRVLSVSLDPSDPILQKPPMSLKKLVKRIRLSSRALKSEVSSWVNDDYISNFAENLETGKSGFELSVTTLDKVRSLLEEAQDFTMLESTMKSISQSSQADVLAYCADTINVHLPVFAALGSAKVMFQTLYNRLRAISEEQGLIGARPFLASLATLAPRLPGFEQIAWQLKQDLIRADQSSAVDASSPLSDNMASQLQDTESELSEQIEKLANYTSADKPTLERLFQAVIVKVQTCWQKGDERQRPYCILLSRLRVFDTQYFDSLMKGWVQHVRKLSRRPSLSHVFPLLLSSSCMSLTTLFATAPRSRAQGRQPQQSAVGTASVYMQEVLQMLMMPVMPDHVMLIEDCFHFRIIQEQARLEHAKEVMLLIRGALAEYSAHRSQQRPIAQPLDNEKTKSHLLELLRDLVLVDPHTASQTLSLKSPDPKLALLIETLTTRLLIPDGEAGQKSIEQVLQLANEFTLPFCQLKLSLNLSTDESAGSDAAEKLQAQFDSLSTAMDNAIEANNIMWTAMLPFLNPDVTQHLKNRAEARFLDLFPSLKNNASGEGNSQRDDIHMAENLLTVIEGVLRGGSSKASPLSNSVVEKLTDLWEIIGSTNTEHASLKTAVLSHWLPLLLSHITLLASSASTSGADMSKLSNGEARARALIILAGLVQELDSYPSASGKLSERVFDIALVLADNLPEDMRQHCVRVVKDHTSDPRLRYLFSFAPNPVEHFMLAHKDKSAISAMGLQERRAAAMAAMGMGGVGMGMLPPEKLTPFAFRRWEILNEPTPNVGENDTSLNLTLFDARKIK